MSTESPPSDGAIWFDNWCVNTALSVRVTNSQAFYPATNLLTPHRSETCRSTNANDWSARFDMGTDVIPECVALIDSNITNGSSFIQFAGADDSSITTNVVFWNLPTYIQDATRNTLRWYLGTPTSGTLGSGRRFWRIAIFPSLWGAYHDDDYHEIGVVMIGPYKDITIDQGVRIRTKDPSDRQRAYGGALWTDVMRRAAEVDFTVAAMNFRDCYRFLRQLTNQGSSPVLLDLHAASEQEVVKSTGCFYGHLSDVPATGRLESPTDNSIDISFEEARG